MARNTLSIDYTNHIYGEVHIIRQVDTRHWWGHCSCGVEKSFIIANLVSGSTKTCGHGRIIHGRSKIDPEYMVWYNMVDRCHNPECPAYKDYGKRGITVCSEWRTDYMAFLNYIGKRPSPLHTLDRKDNTGRYEPGNVHWANMKAQSNNRRSNRLITIQGVTKTAQQWIETYPHLKGARHILSQRLKRKWSEEKAILTPVRAKRR